MKLKILFLVCALSVSLISSNSIADTILLNNGQSITFEKTWIQDGKVYCLLGGGTVSFGLEEVASIKKAPSKSIRTNGFKFDVWSSGINVYNIFAIAKANDIPLHKNGLISTNKHYNPRVCRKYADSATQYNYRTQLLGRYCEVKLFLTPKSKRLHSLSIRWNLAGSKDNMAFEKEVENIIMKKYGRPRKISPGIFIKKYHWSPQPNINIESRVSASGVTLSYIDTTIQKIGEQEKEIKKNKMKSQYQKSDIPKF
jgi:hypothetical protein